MILRMPALVATVIVIALVAAGCNNPVVGGKDGASVGTIITSDEVVQGTPLIVLTPDGTLVFSVTGAQHDLPIDDATYDHAADGDSLIGVSWTSTPAGRLDVAQGSASTPVTPKIALVADGASYSLDKASLDKGKADATTGTSELKSSGTAWVSVRGEQISDIAIKVGFAGKTQTASVEDWSNPGLSELDDDVLAALDDPGASGNEVRALGRCGEPRLAKPLVALRHSSCTATVTSTPYLPQVGWATTGDGWQAVRFTADPGEYALGTGRQAYFFDTDGVDAVAPDVTLDGEKPVATLDYPSGKVLVFPPGGAGHPGLVITGSYPIGRRFSSSDSPARSIRAVRVTWRMSVS